MRPIIVALITTVATSPNLTHAQVDEPHLSLPASRPEAPGSSLDDLSPGFAVALSLFSTLMPVAIGTGVMTRSPIAGMSLLGLGLGVGPSAGHLYAGELGHFFLLSGIRLALAASGTLMVLFGVAAAFSGEGGGLAIGGVTLGVIAVGLAVYDCVDAPNAVHRANTKGRSSLVVTPTVAAAHGVTQYGVSAAMRF